MDNATHSFIMVIGSFSIYYLHLSIYLLYVSPITNKHDFHGQLHSARTMNLSTSSGTFVRAGGKRETGN